ISTDSEQSLALGINLRFSIAEDPYASDYKMRSTELSNSGGISARAFLDANGNGIYDDGEELLPDVEIRSLQSGRGTWTNAKGISFLPGLPRSRRTDITVNAGGLPDPYFMSLNPGESIRPRPGVTSRFDFPIVTGGEMDGTTSYEG